MSESRRRCLDAEGRDWIRDGVDWLERWCTDGRDERLATLTALNGEGPAERTAVRIRHHLG